MSKRRSLFCNHSTKTPASQTWRNLSQVVRPKREKKPAKGPELQFGDLPEKERYLQISRLQGSSSPGLEIRTGSKGNTDTETAANPSAPGPDKKNG